MKFLLRVFLRFIAPITLSITSVLAPIAFSTGKSVFELIKLHGIAGNGDALSPFFSILCFFCSGLFLGAMDPRFWVVSSVLTIAVFPVLIIAEVVLNIGHHNLFPFEIGVYVVVGLPTIGGAALGATLVRFFQGTRPTHASE